MSIVHSSAGSDFSEQDDGREISSCSRRPITRRDALHTLAGASAALAACGSLRADPAKSTAKQVLFVWLDGAMSQFESWDPKPGTRFGGPFQAIQSKLPGVVLSELMPQMAQRMDRFSVVRSMHTKYEDHSKGVIPIQQGDPKNRGVTYPLLGSAVVKLLDATRNELPPYIHIKPGSGGFMFQDAGFLGPKYGALALGDGKAPPNLVAPREAEASRADRRKQIRDRLNSRFAQGRSAEASDAYNHTYRIAEQMARNAKLFDSEGLLPQDVARYGGSQFGRHLLQARQLIEAGVTFVKVTMYHWDTHGDNFNCHLDGVTQVDMALSALLDDLKDRGLYDQTLVLVLSEFGRTPKINARVGRDHWPECWSLGLGGGGIRTGIVLGKTNDLGTFNAQDEFDIGHVYHTVFRALGIDAALEEYDNGGQPLPIAHEGYQAIADLLA